jgi:hypothetical protein
LLTAYYQEGPPDQEGLGGKRHPASPPCPWYDRETAVRRDREVGAEHGGQPPRHAAPPRSSGSGRTP